MRTPVASFAVCAATIAFFASISCAACSSFGPKVDAPTSFEGKVLADYVKTLNACQDEGKDAGTYKAYDDCKKRHGIE